MTKWLTYLFIFTLPLMACGKKGSTNSRTETFHVSGNCGMCKKTIEKSLKVKGVIEADWNKKTKMITVVYDTTLINLDQIKKDIALAGYDNDVYKSDETTYNNLHSCCQYDREK